MDAKKVMLTMSDALFRKIEGEKKKFGYSSVQEVMNEVLRDRFFRVLVGGKSKAGRPRKFDETKLITRQGKIFSRKGVPIEV